MRQKFRCLRLWLLLPLGVADGCVDPSCFLCSRIGRLDKETFVLVCHRRTRYSNVREHTTPTKDNGERKIPIISLLGTVASPPVATAHMQMMRSWDNVVLIRHFPCSISACAKWKMYICCINKQVVAWLPLFSFYRHLICWEHWVTVCLSSVTRGDRKKVVVKSGASKS